MKNGSEAKEGKGANDHPDAGGTGSGFGAAGGAILGGLAGSLAGPGGTVVGALAGAAAGGAVGHVVGAGGWADGEESAYWQGNLADQPFYREGFDYGDYAQALRLGAEGFRRAGGASFGESEVRLAEEWERAKGSSRLSWEQAREAARAAWERARSRPEEGSG